MVAHLLGGERFERAIARLMKQDQDRHTLTQSKAARTIALLGAARQTLLVPDRFTRLTEIIDSAEQFEEAHRWVSFVVKLQV